MIVSGETGLSLGCKGQAEFHMFGLDLFYPRDRERGSFSNDFIDATSRVREKPMRFMQTHSHSPGRSLSVAGRMICRVDALRIGFET